MIGQASWHGSVSLDLARLCEVAGIKTAGGLGVFLHPCAVRLARLAGRSCMLLLWK